MSAIELELRDQLRSSSLNALLLAVLLVGGIGTWATVTPISGAVVATGLIIVEANVKAIQHPSGGVVEEILVGDGDLVEANQVLVRLDETSARTNLAVAQVQLDRASAAAARLRAERDAAYKVTFTGELTDRSSDSVIAEAIASETALFESRRRGHAGRLEQMREQIGQIQQQIEGLTAQIAAKQAELALVEEEIGRISELQKDGLVGLSSLKQLQRSRAQLQGEYGQLLASRASAGGKANELRIQLLQLDQDFATDVIASLGEAETAIAQLRQQRDAARTDLDRVEIRSPLAGYVNHLAMHTVGGVVAPGQTIMEIVPASATLVVETRIFPRDIDQLALGAGLRVRLLAGNLRTTPDLDGVLTYIAADQTSDTRTGERYFVARASISTEDVAALDEITLMPGMPVEVFIATEGRTPLQYLLQPLAEQLGRAFRER